VGRFEDAFWPSTCRKALVAELQALWWPGKEEAPLAELSERDLQAHWQLAQRPGS